MKSKRLMTIGIVLALLIAVVGVVLSVSLTACGKDVITVRSEKELLKAAGTSQEKTIVLMDDVVVNGDLKVAAPNKIDLNGFGLEVKGTLSADGSGTLVVGTTALILARRETVKAQKIDINMPQGHVEWNANIELPASAAASADAMTVVTSASSFVFKGVFKIGGAEADIMLTLKGGRFEISNLSESSAATVLVPEQAVGAAVENLSQGAMRVEAHSDVAVGGEVEISSKNSEVNVTALESQAETKITVTDGTVKKIDAAGAQVVVAESAQAGDVVAEKLENNGTVTGAVVADEIVNNGTLEEENVNAALKTAAKKALNDSFATYSQDDYTSDNWAKLTKAKDDGLAAIDSALTEAAIQSAKNAALDAMAAVETIAEATAEAKAAATAALKTAFEGYTETDYDAQTWATLKAAYDNGLAAIEAATDVSAVNTAKQTALDAMAACVPKDVEALTQAKAEAKAAIETAFKAYDEDDYASANWTELTIAYNKGLNEVDAATSVSAVNAAKQKALDAMAAVKNNATLLAEAKTAALAALDAAKAEYSQADYATNWSVLEKAYNDGKTEINAAAAIEAVNSALQKATDAMAAVKNDATLLAEAKTAATDQLNSEYAKYKATDYTNANYELLTEKYNAGLSAIGGARTVDAVETALETAVAEMAAIKTNAQILSDAKAAAKQAVNEAFAAYNEQDYTVDNWSALVKVKDDGLAAIEAAAKTDVAAEAGEAAIAAMAAVKNNATLLAEAKATAKSELETEYKKYKKTDYTANWSQLESAYNSGLTAIENAATIELAQAAKNEAVTAMAAVKNDATLLAEAKTAAKSELETEKAKYSQSDYTINWSVLEQAYNDGLTAIDASKTTSAVDTAKQAAIAAMAAVKTDAEELEAAKSAAKDELKEYFDAFNKAYYYETSLQALQTAYDSGVSAISAAQSVADVATALANAKTALDNVKADVTEVNDADSLKAAVEAQYSKIILTANISGAYIEVNYDLTLDLNEKTLLYTGSGTGSNPQNGEAISVSAGKLVLKNGTVNMVNDEAGGLVYWGIRVHGTGSLAMSKVTVKSEDSPLFMSAVPAGGKIYLTLDECYIEGVYSAVYMNGSSSPAEITINNSTIVSKDVGIYVSNSVNTGNRQKLTITDSTVTGTTAIEVKHTDATITGCTLISTAAEQKSQINDNGSCTEGFAFAVTGNGDADKTTGTVVVSGCKFYNGKPSSTDAEENGFYFVFTTAEGASVTVDGAAADETAAYGAYEARVSNAWFDTFENAVKYAEANGKTVVLLKDVEVGEAGNAATGLVVSGTLTVDFNGHTVSNKGTGFAIFVKGSEAKVIFVDSSEKQTGGIHGGSGGNNQALRVQDGANVEIYGGNYNVGVDAEGFGNSTVAISTDSVVYIYGGRFASEKDYQGKYFVLNVQQTTGASGFIKVYGGTFVGQNPADGDDALGGSFVAKGYEAFVSKAATDDSLAEYTVGKVYEAGSEEALRGAIAAAQGFSVVRLTADVDLKEELYINGVDLMLDLNGFTLSLHYGEGVKRNNCSTLYVANATLIINDSSEDKSGRVENTDTTGGTNLSSKDNNYAVRVGREANLIINGGTFYTSADSAGNGNSVILIYSTSSNESTVTINGGVFETEAAYNGTYFVLNVQDGFKGGYVVCGGTFKGYKPGTTNTGELATVPEGYEIAEQEIENGVVWYTVQKAQ